MIEKTKPAAPERPGCDTCRFCGVMLNNPNATQVLLQCRRESPRTFAQVIGMGQNPMDPKGPPVPMWNTTSAWPLVQRTDWCGEYQPEPNRMN